MTYKIHRKTSISHTVKCDVTPLFTMLNIEPLNEAFSARASCVEPQAVDLFPFDCARVYNCGDKIAERGCASSTMGVAPRRIIYLHYHSRMIAHGATEIQSPCS